MTRAQMLLLALILMHVLLGALCLAVASGERPSRALRYWGAGLLVYSVGALMTVMVDVLPLDFRQTVGNTLVSASAILTTRGLLSYTRYRINLAVALAGLAALFIILAVNHASGPLYVVDVGAPTTYASLLYLYAAYGLLRSGRPAALHARRFVAAVTLLAVLMWNARWAAVWMSASSAPDASQADLALSVFAIFHLLALVALSLGLLWIEVRLMEANLEEAALSDWLTGLQNRRAMHARFKEGISHALRHNQPFAMVTFDIDHFKRINDRYGHLAGDVMLRAIAKKLQEAKRTEDQLGRHGGEEFLLLLPDQSGEEAAGIAERLREEIEQLVVNFAGKELRVTISAGVSAFPDDGESWDRLFGAADRRLYMAKDTGRNRVVASD